MRPVGTAVASGPLLRRNHRGPQVRYQAPGPGAAAAPTARGARHLYPAVRRCPDAVAGYVDKVRRHAYQVTDRDIEQLREAGYSEDQIFELTVAAAYGAARLRLDRAMDAMAALSSSAEASREGGGS